MSVAEIRNQANNTYRDYENSGLPSSGEHEPVKSEIRDLFGTVAGTISDVQAQVGAVATTGAVGTVKPTFSDLSADLAHDAGSLALVYADPNPSRNGYYVKSGASGTGEWDKTDLGYSVAQTERVLSGNDSASRSRNVVYDPDYRMLGDYFSAFGIYNVNKPTVVDAVDPQGVTHRALKYSGASTTDYNVDDLGGAGGVFSASITVAERVDPGVGAFIFFQFRGAGDSDLGGAAWVEATGQSDAQWGVFQRDAIAIPANTKIVRRFVFVPSGASFTVLREGLYPGRDGSYRPSEAPPAFVVVSPTGNDGTGNGSLEAPFATPARGLRALRDHRTRSVYGTLLLRGGTYDRPSVVLGDDFGFSLYVVERLAIRAYAGEEVNWRFGTTLAGFAKTGGRTNVYQTALVDTPLNFFIFEDGTPEGEIVADERHPAQRGGFPENPSLQFDTAAQLNADLSPAAGTRARVNRDANPDLNGMYEKVGAGGGGNWAKTVGRFYRSPSLRLQKVDSLAACDATPGTWYWAANVVYIHAPGSTNPSTNGKSYVVPERYAQDPTRQAVGFARAGTTGHFEMSGVRIWYPYSGVSLDGAASSMLTDVMVIGAANYAFAAGDSHVEINCTSIASGQDGFGSDSNNRPVEGVKRVLRMASYAAMNGDEGTSDHRRVAITRVACLDEYNGDGGNIPAVGAFVQDYDCVARFNGQRYGKEVAGESPVGGENFGCREGGVYYGHNCRAQGSPSANFSSGAGCFMELHAPLSRNGAVGYRGNQSGDGTNTMVAHDPRDLGSVTAKAGTSTILSYAPVA